jgi:hypothetical protein
MIPVELKMQPSFHLFLPSCGDVPTKQTVTFCFTDMSHITKLQILKLYKDLLRYGQGLRFTDKDYFCNRIRREFRKNRELGDESEISFNFEVRSHHTSSKSNV